jgi:DNA helicase HerA-like ATPase
VKLKPQEEKSDKCFTDFNGRFRARLSAVIPRIVSQDSKFAGISAKYDCRIKVEYQKDLMGLLEEGMLLAVKNFKPVEKGSRFTLLEISRVWPEHFGLRGLSDRGYYPMQFEIIQQSEADWSTNDKATMMVQISSIPVNYDLFLDEQMKCNFRKGFSYPIIASEAYVLNSEMINLMYNQKIVQKLGVDTSVTFAEARKDPRLGLVKMFEVSKAKIPIYVDFEDLVRYHFGVFAFTGGGKSNLMSNILRRILYHTEDTKVVIFDISCEYPFLLMDAFADSNMSSQIILENRVDTVQQFYDSIVKPKDYEGDERVVEGLKKIFDFKDRIGYFTKPKLVIPNYAKFLEELKSMLKDSSEKPHYVNALDEIKQNILGYMEEKRLAESQLIDETFVRFIHEKASDAVEKFKVSDKSGVYAWATTRIELLDVLRKSREEEQKEIKGLTTRRIQKLIEGEERLVCISISDPLTIKSIVMTLTRNMLAGRKREFKVKPYVLFVFDEAQEFIPDSGSTGIDKVCSEHVETLLRQGRKYGLGGCVATQRIAYLNTNALQQLHTYFVGTLPRPYDRQVVSNTFMIDQGILEKTLEFAPGEWLLSSYIATGIENVPIFIKADNAEDEIKNYLAY